MNLIYDKWIPAERKDGSTALIAPFEIGASDNPVMEIRAPRPDFRGALYQFLIGLVQTAFSPATKSEWRSRWEAAPTCESLKAAFGKFSEAFELYNPDGPAFMQDFNLPEDAVENQIRSLLIDAPGEKTIEDNKDHFVKRNMGRCLCPSCAASALFSLQINAPSGGQGNRTGLRGGGPITTLVMPNKNSSLWEKIWLNILSKDELPFEYLLQNRPDPRVFPWLDKTIESTNDKKVFPGKEADYLQQFWGMPRRIRLDPSKEEGICSICGRKDSVYTSYKSKNLGISYASIWQHMLSPYRLQTEKSGMPSLIALKGKQGGASYMDWLAFTLLSDFDNGNHAEMSANIKIFVNDRLFTDEMASSGWHIWCFGFDMDNMKARCWYDQKMPIINIDSDDKRSRFIEDVQKMTAAAFDCSRILRDQVKEAWFNSPKDAKGDMSFVDSAFFDATENVFYRTADEICKALNQNKEIRAIMEQWSKYLKGQANSLFDRFAIQDTEVIISMKRVDLAAKGLAIRLSKDKAILALNEEDE